VITRRWIPFLALASAAIGSPAARADIDSSTLAVLVNDADPISREVGDYYAAARRIPERHLIHVRVANDVAMSRASFAEFSSSLTAQLANEHVEALAITWRRPYRVDCMSITSALALGFDERYCATGCYPTKPSPLYDARTSSPLAVFGVRPTMMIAAATLRQTKELIDRGVRADANAGASVDALLVTTTDVWRNVRSAEFAAIAASPPPRVHPVRTTEFPTSATNVMFYFTGAVRVPHIDSIRFAPGAIADHLTSAGAIFEQDEQMTVLDWLDAGATASYGTVVEPCSFKEKFPDPNVAIRRYADGAPLIEAYWESVRMPGQGLFIGEPLARPFAKN